MPPDPPSEEPGSPTAAPSGAAVATGHTGNVYDFRTGARFRPESGDSEQRYSQRATDKLTTSFYEACRLGNMGATLDLMEGLEREVVRSCGLWGGDWREDGHDVADVHARYQLEMERRASSAALLPADRL